MKRRVDYETKGIPTSYELTKCIKIAESTEDVVILYWYEHGWHSIRITELSKLEECKRQITETMGYYCYNEME